MTGIESYLIGAVAGLGLKFLADLAVRLSKKTANTIDDMIAESFKSVVGSINFFKKK